MLTERGTHLKVHKCFCTQGEKAGIGTVELKYMEQLQRCLSGICSSADTNGYTLMTVKCYYSTVHTAKAVGMSMRPNLRTNKILR